jgi:hypothetical protein
MGKRKHVLNEAQLAMFIPAHKLMDMITPESAGYEQDKPPASIRNTPQTIRAKRNEARMEGLDKEIKAEGVKEPITIMQNPHVFNHHHTGKLVVDDYFPGHDYKGPMIADGHHRIVVANDINPNAEIPVKYD